MQFRTTTYRLGVVASATSLLFGIALGGSANAVSVGAGAVTAITPAGLHNVTATLSYDATPYPGGAMVEFSCKAMAWVDPASTGFDVCSVAGQDAIGAPGNYPGAVAVAAGLVWVPDGSQPWACVGAHATFAEPYLGPLYKATPVRCRPLDLLEVAAGSAD